MQVIGFNFKKISSERKKEKIEDKLEVKSNIEIENIDKEKVDLLKEEDILRFNFSFKIDYHPDFASLEFKGFALIILDPEQSKRILKSWKEKKVPDEIRIPLFNLILTKCNLRALQLEEELGLPTHVPLPRIAAQQQGANTNYTG
jgi:hypothetical protein